jgi:hypothetical protein
MEKRCIVRGYWNKGLLFGLSLLALGLLALSAPAASAVAQYWEIPAYQGLNLTAINGSRTNASQPVTIAPTLEPITLLHLEWNETTPSGVRYMAFGPKVIEIAVDPLLLAILAGLGGAAAGAWYLFRRGPGEN